MNETQRRIKAYKAALPGLKERVFAVAIMLAMSVAMMTSATFAWLTISRRPEVSEINTNVAANGNLEIALVPLDGKEPAESKVGDSSAADGQSIVDSNLTWGNLINLSDPSYGLENLTLRPAQLNKDDLLNSPLHAAKYDADGRVTQVVSDFAYTVWNEREILADGSVIEGAFRVTKGASSDILGVRAISSTKVTAQGADAIFKKFGDAATTADTTARNIYNEQIAQNGTYMTALQSLINAYLSVMMDSSADPSLDPEDVNQLILMYGTFMSAYDKEFEAIANVANLTLLIKYGLKEGSNTEPAFTPYTAEDIKKLSLTDVKNEKGESGANGCPDVLDAEGIYIKDLVQFIKDYNTVVNDKKSLETKVAELGTLTWKTGGINTIVAHLVDVDKCYINNIPVPTLKQQLKEDMVGTAMGMIGGADVKITNGLLKNFELRTGSQLNVSIKVTLYVSINCKVFTDIDHKNHTSYFTQDKRAAEAKNDGSFKGGVAEAQDTYGMAIDFWVRSNASNSYLTLEGNVLTETHKEEVKGKNANGDEVQIYTITVKVDTGDAGDIVGDMELTEIVDVYSGTVDDGTGEKTVWYNAVTHAQISDEEMDGQTPVKKVEDVVTIIGYEGENRVWQDNAAISVDATTQGSGSCYVYYADTPEDQARSLRLLSAMRVSFADANGNLLATAYMDAEKAYEESGRVTVPLVLDPTASVDLGESITGEKTYAITMLEKNEPTRITALVYLDGTKVTNQDVLAASDIQGQLNIQFGSNGSLAPIDNDALADKILRVTAAVDKTTFDYDTATEPMTTRVTVTVEGDAPTNMTAFFTRVVSPTQGAREKTFTLKDNGDGTWSYDYTFDNPGVYVLRSVQLDGQNYDLSGDDLPTVTVKGFNVASLNMTGADANNHVRVLSVANATSVNLSLKFAADEVEKLPKTVSGRFMNDATGAAVNVEFKMDATSQIWTGKANFATSGDYTMKFLVLDGETQPLEERHYQTADITLGLRVAVYTTDIDTFDFIPDDMNDPVYDEDGNLIDDGNGTITLEMQVKILDNAGNSLPGLSDVKLTYGLRGSATKTMDTDLNWNGTYYVGSLKSLEGGPGIWQFKSLQVGSNTLTSSSTAPVFTIRSTDPPEYYGYIPGTDTVALNGGATMNVQMKYTSTAAARAWIQNEEGKGAWVTLDTENTADSQYINEVAGQDGKVHNWNFPIPTTVNGLKTQDGVWTMTEVQVYKAYDKSGKEYTLDDPFVIDMRDKNHTVKVIQTVNVEFPEDKSYNYGRTGGAANGAITAAFMTEHTVNGMSVDIKDYKGDPIEGVSDVKLTFTYRNNSSKDYGGYTSADLTNGTPGATVTVPLNTVNGTRYSQSVDGTLLYAGYYYTALHFKVGNTSFDYSNDSSGGKALPSKAPLLTVWSKAPTVKITGVSPISTTMNSGGNSVAVTNSVNDNGRSVTAYITGTWHNTLKYWDYAAPQITVKITNGGSFSSASFTLLSSDTSDSSKNNVFTFTANDQSVPGDMGYGTDGYTYLVTSGDGEKYPIINKQIISSLTVVAPDGLTYTVSLSDSLTFYQPDSGPPKVSFAINDSTFTGTVPASVTSVNGETTTVTLPTIASWTTPGQSSTGDKTTTTTTEYLAAIGSHESSGNIFNRSYYYNWTLFTRVTTVTTTVGTTTTWTNTHQITGWKVGNTVYEPGDTVTLTGNQTITAVVTITEGTKTETPATTVQTVAVTTETGTTTTSSDWKGTTVTVPSGYTRDDSATAGETETWS